MLQQPDTDTRCENPILRFPRDGGPLDARRERITAFQAHILTEIDALAVTADRYQARRLRALRRITAAL
jgi:hypothetical protein